MNSKQRLSPREIIKLLDLQELPLEGGFFHQTYVSTDLVAQEHLPARYAETKSFCTAIVYLLTPKSFSAFHRLPTDEVYHYYLGDPAELFELHSDGSRHKTILGPDLASGHQVQQVVQRGAWQASRVQPGGEWTVLGTTMAPGYTQSDFELGQISALQREFPEHRKIIQQLTRIDT